MNQEKIGNFIKEIRLKNGLSQQKFADKLSVTFQAVSKWETGKNIPDIAILKQISKEFNVNIDEIINAKYNKKSKDKLITIICLSIITIIIGIIIIVVYNKDTDYKFKILTSSCSNFNITGSIAYNDKKSSFYITNIEYCGGNDTTIYNKIEATIYEKNNDIITKISTSKSKENITLEEYLKTLSFKLEHYSKACKHFEDDSLYIEIIGNTNNNSISYKIPLKLTDNCK